MNNSYPLIARIVSIVLMLIGVIMWVVLAYTADDQNEGIVNAFVTYGKWMVIIGFVLAVLSSVMSLVINPGAIKGAVIGIIAIAVIFGLSYVLADGTVLPSYKNVDESTSKLVSTGLNSFYIIGLLAVLSVVYSGVARIFK
jgi:hypothetical protein